MLKRALMWVTETGMSRIYSNLYQQDQQSTLLLPRLLSQAPYDVTAAYSCAKTMHEPQLKNTGCLKQRGGDIVEAVYSSL